MSSRPSGVAHAKPVRFPKEFLNELRSLTPMAPLVGRRVKLTPSGKHHKGRCPFHDDKKPSLTVYSDHFHCFGCQAHGDAIEFVTRTEDIAFQDAVARLAGDAGLAMPDTFTPRAHPLPAPPPQPAKAPPMEQEDWHPMVPPPADAPLPTAAQLRCDKLYVYRGAQGELLHYVRRFEARGGKDKDFRPLTYGTLKGRKGWHTKAPAAPRPLYGLDKLAARPDAPVVTCEGEKAADAAEWLLPDRVCVSWSGGSKAVKQADWDALRKRRTDKAMWPDNDAPGHAAAAEVAALVPGMRLLRVDDLPHKADAADVQPDDPEAWLRDRLPPETASVADYLSTGWRTREFAPPVRLLGDLVTSTSRTFLVGATGLGKTMLGLAMAAGMATGTGFLDWKCDRSARILYVDGEMPSELVQARMKDALCRTGREDLSRNLFIYSLDDGEKFAAAYPQLSIMEPLNTEAGQSFIFRLIDAIGGVDAVIFDNVMSLIIGDQKDEVPWSETLPLVSGLTRHNVGQIWFDHAGHNADRQYGSSTKAWRFDAVGIMTKLPEDEQAPRETAFKLSFDAPGKARRRTPENWDQFAPRTIRLTDGKWAGNGAAPPENGKGKGKRTNEEAATLLREILQAFAKGKGGTARPEAGMPEVPTIKRKVLQDELESRGWLRLSSKLSKDGSKVESLPDREHQRLWKRLNTLKLKGEIGFNRDDLWLIKAVYGS